MIVDAFNAEEHYHWFNDEEKTPEEQFGFYEKLVERIKNPDILTLTGQKDFAFQLLKHASRNGTPEGDMRAHYELSLVYGGIIGALEGAELPKQDLDKHVNYMRAGCGLYGNDIKGDDGHYEIMELSGEGIPQGADYDLPLFGYAVELIHLGTFSHPEKDSIVAAENTLSGHYDDVFHLLSILVLRESMYAINVMADIIRLGDKGFEEQKEEWLKDGMYFEVSAERNLASVRTIKKALTSNSTNRILRKRLTKISEERALSFWDRLEGKLVFVTEKNSPPSKPQKKPLDRAARRRLEKKGKGKPKKSGNGKPVFPVNQGALGFKTPAYFGL